MVECVNKNRKLEVVEISPSDTTLALNINDVEDFITEVAAAIWITSSELSYHNKYYYLHRELSLSVVSEAILNYFICRSQHECESACLPICSQPFDKGLDEFFLGVCKADIPRFYFDSRTNRCHSFKYTGCGGNNNNFLWVIRIYFVILLCKENIVLFYHYNSMLNDYD